MVGFWRARFGAALIGVVGSAAAVGGCGSSGATAVAATKATASTTTTVSTAPSQAAVTPPAGDEVTVTFTVGSSGTAPDALKRELSIINQRIASEKLSATTASLSRDGRGLVVQGPAAAKDQLEMLGRAGVLSFRPVLASGGGRPAPSPAPPGVSADLWQKFESLDCNSAPQADEQPTAQIVACQDDGLQKYVLDATAVSGTSVTSAGASAGTGATGGTWLVDVSLNSQGAAQFAQVTRQLAGTGRQLAITVDGIVYSAPTVEEPITDGNLQITGQFTESTAQSLAAILQNGALPTALNMSSVSTVGG